jgi:hypothetical protein
MIAKEIENKLGDVSVEELKEFSRTRPALLFPAFHMQQILQEGTLGESFWKYYSTRRIELSKGQYIPITEFMEIHTDKELKHSILSNTAGKKLNKKTLEIIEKTGSAADRRMSKVAVTDNNNHNHKHDRKSSIAAHSMTQDQHNYKPNSIASLSHSIDIAHQVKHPQYFFEEEKERKDKSKCEDQQYHINSGRKKHETNNQERRSSFDKVYDNCVGRRKSFDEECDHNSRRNNIEKERDYNSRRNSFDKDDNHNSRRNSLDKQPQIHHNGKH